MSRKFPNKCLTFVTDQTFLYYDRNSNHVVISTNEFAEYLPFTFESPEFDGWHAFQEMPKHSLLYIFATNAYGFNEDQQKIIIKIKKELLSHSKPNTAPVLVSEKHLFDIIDIFQYSTTPEQINTLIINNKNQEYSI